MTTKPPPGGGKPFLGDDDLLSELDAWDATFDALHTDAPAPAGQPAAEPPPMEWPPAAPAPQVKLSPIAPSPVVDDVPEVEVEHPPVAKKWLPAQTASDTFDEDDPLETDFSDLGAQQAPAAMGEMLGRPGTPPFAYGQPDDEAEPARTEEEEVFTSASRPDLTKISAPPVQQTARTSPAIIRRTTSAMATVRPVFEPPPSFEGSSEETKISDLSAIEARAMEAGQRNKTPTAPPPVLEDDYADIEIDSTPAPRPVEAIPSAPASAPVRRTAHIMRRVEPPATRPPPMGQPMPNEASRPVALPQPVVEKKSAPIVTDEDDFSDVAAAVGASEDLLPPPPSPALDAPTGRGGPLPRPQVSMSAPRRVEIDPDIDLSTPILDPVDPLAAFDDDDDGDKPTAISTLPPTSTMRPPALVDLYPRVKTPTSVPPMGSGLATGQVPTRTMMGIAPAAMPQQGSKPHRIPTQVPEYIAEDVPDVEPPLDLDALALPEQLEPLGANDLDADGTAMLEIYERELATVDESATTATLRVEAGRLYEHHGDLDHARIHYDAALLADPRATVALRGLRRIARNTGDLTEATRQLDAELEIAGALEKRPLSHYRVDLLMACGEQDLARVAVGEILDSAPSDVRALLAHLELAFLDGRADEFGGALEQLAQAISDPELRAATQSARAALAAHHNDTTGAAQWFSAAAESDPQAIGARLGAIRHAAAQADGEGAGKALVELARRLDASDATTAAALALRAQQWATGETAMTAAAISTAAVPMDPLVARLAAERSTGAEDPAVAGAAFAHWAACPGTAAERAYAAARAAELFPGRGAELWALALELDPGDDYGAAQLRTAYVAAEDAAKAIEVDLAIAGDETRDRARLRAAFSLIAQGQLDPAIELLAKGRAERPTSLAIAEALGEALAAAGRWADRARLFAELAEEPGEQLDKDVAQLRSALAWEEAVGAAAEQGEGGSSPSGDLQRATAAALEAWDKVLEQNGGAAAAAYASAIVLASRLGDRDVLADVLARAQASEKSPWAMASLALRRARLYEADEPTRSESILSELDTHLDDPRRVVALAMAAARRGEVADVAAALEDRANRLAEGTEPAALRLRAAQLALDAGDAAKATTLLGLVERALPSLGVIPDLLAAARRRAGDRPALQPTRTDMPTGGDAFGRLLRDADLAAAHDDGAAALALYQRALELRPNDPLAVVPMVRVAMHLREPAPLTALALARLRVAEGANDNVAKAEAYELLARIDATLRDDSGSAQIALESALQADPARVDLVHRLERHYAANDQLSDLIRLRRAALDNLSEGNPKDRAGLVVDLAALAARDHRPDDEIAAFYRTALAAEPKHRLALLHLESIVRRPGPSAELAELEQAIASAFTGDGSGDNRSEAAFLTRAGETYAEINAIDKAVEQFRRATAVLPGHVYALEGWRWAALKGQLWADVAEAASEQAHGTVDAQTRARLHHLAGVALMDKALDGDKAAKCFHRALVADQKLTDAFLRLRILLEEDGNHEDLATLLANRLEVEADPTAQIELHRALADLHRNFLSDRDTAKKHFRAILAADSNDLRAHAAVADIAWEQGNWQEAADALVARARLEREPDILKTLCYRLGLIYADRLVDVPMALKAFQRALTYSPDDENTLVRLADLATTAGEWKLALGACERLVKAEADPDRRAAHLQRVARIFKDGFNDAKRAERALNLALDSAPTNDEALSALVGFYRDAGDMMSVRVHLNRVAGAMRARFEKDPKDGIACRVISRAMAARDQAGVPGSSAIARSAAELADLLGAAGEPESRLLADGPRAEPARLTKPETDEVLFPRGVQTELRQIFQLLGDKVAKHVGTDLRAYGVTRGDRLRARDSEVAAAAQEIATGLGFGEIDVFVSARNPFAMAAEPTSPVSLVIGQAIASGSKTQVRFAAGAALKLAQASLAIPARLAPDELGVLVVALMRLFQPEFPFGSVDADAVGAQMQKLRRLIPTGLFNELRPFALAVDGQRLGHRELARDLRVAGLRAGLIASGSLLAGLGILAQQAQTTIDGVLSDPVAAGLVSFALAEDHATAAR